MSRLRRRERAMHIRPFQNRSGGESPSVRVRQDLNLLLSQPTDREQRPCSDCHERCGCSKHSVTCCCSCSADCLNVPRQLSSDPDLYPIEPRIVPLVYELNALRVVEPCWSCEGHAPQLGKPMKLPQVWFTSPSPKYADLLMQHIGDLYAKKKLAYSWIVALNPYNPGGDAVTYVVRPDLARVSGDPKLDMLQLDLQTIAKELRTILCALARGELRNLSARGAA